MPSPVRKVAWFQHYSWLLTLTSEQKSFSLLLNPDCSVPISGVPAVWKDRTVDVIMARAKRIYVLMIKVSKFSLFSSSNFMNKIGNMFSVFVATFVEVWDNLKKLFPHWFHVTPRKYVFWRHSNWSVVITIGLCCPAIDQFSEIGVLLRFKVENILDTSRYWWAWRP